MSKCEKQNFVLFFPLVLILILSTDALQSGPLHHHSNVNPMKIT